MSIEEHPKVDVLGAVSGCFLSGILCLAVGNSLSFRSESLSMSPSISLECRKTDLLQKLSSIVLAFPVVFMLMSYKSYLNRYL
jgi:hypothetical protein